MKISLIGPTNPFRGGISMYSSLLYNQLKTRHEIQFISFKKMYPSFLYPGKTDKDSSSRELLNIRCERIFKPFSPISWFATFKRIKAFSPELVIFSWWVSFFAPSYFILIKLLKWKTNSKILFLCHNVIEHESNPIKRLFTKSVLKNGNFFIVHSDMDYMNLNQFIPKDKIKKEHHPLYDIYNLTTISREEARNKLKEEEGIILFFGFVRKYKGLKYLIQALAKIPSTVKAKLYIVGEFWESRAQYDQLINSLNLMDRIVINDSYIRNEDVEVYFKASDIVVLPYISATGSGIVQLAYGFDRPVIVTDTGSLPEVVVEGKTGFVVRSGDPYEIAEKLQEFYSIKDKSSFSTYISEYKKKFTFTRIVDSMEEITCQK